MVIDSLLLSIAMEQQASQIACPVNILSEFRGRQAHCNVLLGYQQLRKHYQTRLPLKRKYLGDEKLCSNPGLG